MKENLEATIGWINKYQSLQLKLNDIIASKAYRIDCYVIANGFPFMNVVVDEWSSYYYEIRNIILALNKDVSITYEYIVEHKSYLNVLVKM